MPESDGADAGVLSPEDMGTARLQAYDLIEGLERKDLCRIFHAIPFLPTDPYRQTKRQQTLGIVLAGHFDIFLDCLEKLAALDCGNGIRELYISVCANWIECINFTSSFRGFPTARVQRYFVAALDITFLNESIALRICTTTASPQIIEVIVQLCFRLWTGLTNLRYRNPVIKVNFGSLVSHKAFNAKAPSRTKTLPTSTRRDVLLYECIMAIETTAMATNNTILARHCMALTAFCIAFDLPSSSPPLHIAPSQLNLIFRLTARFNQTGLSISDFVAAYRLNSTEYCIQCGCYRDMAEEQSARYKNCSGCGFALYCSKQCQVKHWKEGGHKVACSKICLREKAREDQ